MTDQDLLAASPLSDMDVWNANKNIDRFKLNYSMAQLRLAGDLDTAAIIADYLTEYKSRLSIDPTDTVQISQSKVKEIRTFKERVERSNHYQLVDLKIVGASDARPLPIKFRLKEQEAGRWVRSKGSSEAYSTFDADFPDLDPKTESMLESSGFRKQVRERVPDSIRVVQNARFHAFDKSFYTVSFDDSGKRSFDTSFAARVAGESTYNALAKVEHIKIVEEAIVLPIEVINSNFYHVLSEKIHGMRLLSLFDDGIPIIYTGDDFGLVELFAKKMNIDPRRLVCLDEAQDWLVRKAALIYPGAYTWTRSVFDFFGQFAKRETKPHRRIYISRLGSRREFSNELEIQEVAVRCGYEVIYPESLSIEDQIQTFSAASTIVAGHGAGLAHLAFMSSGTRLLELFPRYMIKPDYYLRSRSNSTEYSFIIADTAGNINTSVLESRLRMNRVIEIDDRGAQRVVQEYPGMSVNFSGLGSIVRIERGSVLRNVRIDVSNHSSVYIGKTAAAGIANTEISIGGPMSNKELFIGQNSEIDGSHIYMEGEDDLSVRVGRDNFWSPGVVVRATDGRQIRDRSNSGAIVNRAQPISIGDAVWIGCSAVVARGAKVSSGSVIDHGAFVSDEFEQSNVVIAGVPAHVVRSNIEWLPEAISRDLR